MNTTRDLAELAEHVRQSFFYPGQLGPRLWQLTRNAVPGAPQLKGQCDELLLDAIVEVPLDPPPELPAGRADPDEAREG